MYFPKLMIIILFINIMCNPFSDWGTRIQPLTQVIHFVPQLGHEHFFHILYCFSGYINLIIIVIFQL